MSNNFNELIVKKRAVFNGKVCFNKTGGCDNVQFRGPAVFEEGVTTESLKSRNPDQPIVVEDCLEACEPIKVDTLQPKSGKDINIDLADCETLVVDDFSDPHAPSPLELSDAGPQPDTGEVSGTGSMLGGARRAWAQSIGTFNTFVAYSSGIFEIANASSTFSVVHLIWDGSTTGGLTVDGTGLGGINLMEIGSENLAIKIETSDQTATATLELYTNNTDYSTLTIMTPSGVSTEAIFPLSNLTIAGGAGADLTNIGAIKVIINQGTAPGGGHDYRLSGICFTCENEATVCLKNVMTDALIPKTCDITLIDNYSIPQTDLDVTITMAATPTTGEIGITDSSLFGGARRSHINVQNGAGSGTASLDHIPIDPFALLFQGLSMSSTVYITYDGSDTGGDTINFPGLGGIDLTTNGGEKFRAEFSSFSFPVPVPNSEFVIEVYTDAGNYSVSDPVSLLISTETYEVFFTDFNIGAGVGANFADVAAVRLCITDTTANANWALFNFDIMCSEGSGQIQVPKLSYTPANPSAWTSGVPTNIQEALDKLIELIP